MTQALKKNWYSRTARKIKSTDVELATVQSEIPAPELTVTRPFSEKIRAANEVIIQPKRFFWQDMVQELVEKKNYSISQIAYRSGVPKSTVYKLVSHKTANLSYKNFCKILGLYFTVFYDKSGRRCD